MKLQRVRKWLCNRGTGRTHRLRFIRRQHLENVYRPFLIIYAEHAKVPFRAEAHI